MRREVQRLQKLRNQQAYQNSKLSHKKNLRVCDPRHDKLNVKLFEKIRNNYDYKTMEKILKSKLIKEEPYLKPNQIDLLVESMLMNHGGCPV